jgi:hypothetical protein
MVVRHSPIRSRKLMISASNGTETWVETAGGCTGKDIASFGSRQLKKLMGGI